MPNLKKIIFCGKDFNKFKKMFKNSVFLYDCPLITSTKVLNTQDAHKAYTKKYDYTIVSSQEVLKHIDLLKIQTKKWMTIGSETAKKISKLKKNCEIFYPKESFTSHHIKQYLNTLELQKLEILWLTGKSHHVHSIDLKPTYSVDFIQTHENKNVSKKKLNNVLDLIPINQKAYWVFTSPSCVRSYFYHKLFNTKHLLVCIGSETAKRLRYYYKKPHLVCKKHTLQGLYELIYYH